MPHGPRVIIRRATPRDLDRVGELTVAAYDDYTTGPADGYVAHLRDAAARDRDAELWVAEGDGDVVGTVTITPEGSPWREVAESGEAEFRMLAVDAAARGRGVGEALVRHVLDRARASGCRAVVMSSLREMAPAHRVYERLGFIREPGRDWDPVPGVHLIAYRLPLQN